jgi:hypothetical protein
MSDAFRTSFSISPLNAQAELGMAVLSAGSCFATHIHDWLRQNGMHAQFLPNGILYNPASLAQALTQALESRLYSRNNLLETLHGFKSYCHHGSVYSTNADELLERINREQSDIIQFLSSANYLIITLGTSFSYFLKADGLPVANCHKQPELLFERRMLTHGESTQLLQAALQGWLQKNPDLQIILTLSPVRHLRDGIPANAVSKAHLRIAIEALCELLPRCHYFPAYELLLDDLRDYRFYASDMLHPSDTAVAYIRTRFAEVFYHPSARAALPEFQKLFQLLQHRPLHSSNNHKTAIKAGIDALAQARPGADLSYYREIFREVYA